MKGSNNRFEQNRQKNAEKTMKREGLLVLKKVNGLFTEAVDYRQYRLIERSECYKDDVAQELSRMTKEVGVYLKERSLAENIHFSSTPF